MEFWQLKKPMEWFACLFIKHKLHIKGTAFLSLFIFTLSVLSEMVDGVFTADDFRRIAEGASSTQIIILTIAYAIFKRRS
jgi:hypothetical protein